jgi:hypothetical protein
LPAIDSEDAAWRSADSATFDAHLVKPVDNQEFAKLMADLRATQLAG